MRDEIKWTVGQTVGKESGHIARLIFKGTVVKVTKAGRCKVNFSRPDGHMFSAEYTATGRPFPYISGSGYLFPWVEKEHGPKWRKRLDEQAARMRANNEAREEERRERASRRDLIGWALEVILRQNDDRAPAAAKMIEDALMPAPEEEASS